MQQFVAGWVEGELADEFPLSWVMIRISKSRARVRNLVIVLDIRDRPTAYRRR
jgi:hypothetical protein